jgi:hypothetical protein
MKLRYIALVALTIVLVLGLSGRETQKDGTVKLADGEVCLKGETCMCGSLTCGVGCTCNLVGGIGLISCPVSGTYPPLVLGVALLFGIVVGSAGTFFVMRGRGRRSPIQPLDH